MFIPFLIFVMILEIDGRDIKPARHKRYPTEKSTIHFTLNGQHFKMQLLNLTGIQDFKSASVTEEPTVADVVIAEGGTEAIDQIAQINIAERTTNSDYHAEGLSDSTTPRTVGNIEESVKTLKRLKGLYKEFGSLLKAHEKELFLLMQRPESKNDEPKALQKDQEKSKDRSQEDTAININIHNADSKNIIETQSLAHFRPGVHEDVKSDDLNIHVNADPPLKMRTIIGYPLKKGKAQIHGLKKDLNSLRVYPRDAINPAKTDQKYESKMRDILSEDHPSQEEEFLRRFSELLLRQWKYFQTWKRLQIKRQPDDKEKQNFDEESESF